MIKRNVTMKDLANSLNVSIVTVSKALNNKEGVSEQLKKKIQDLADDMGYRYNTIAKSMKEGSTYNIGVIASKRFLGEDSFYLQVYQHITTVLQEYNFYGILEVIDYEDEKNGVLPRVYNERRVDALVILGSMKSSYIEALDDMDIPYIFLDYYDSEHEVDSINTDNYYASYEITSYLISQGHKNIGFVGTIYATSSIQDRFLGYCKALIENRIDINQEWILKDRDDDGVYINIEIPEDLPTAFVCNCDQVAFNFIEMLRNKGIDVPKDCSIVSFDNDIYATISNPKITSVEIDKESMAKKTVEVILDRLENPEKQVGRVLVKSKIIKRDSVKVLK